MIFGRVRAKLANALDRRFSHLESRIDELQNSSNVRNQDRADAERALQSRMDELQRSLDAQNQERAKAESARADAGRALQSSIDAVEDTVNGELRGMVRAIATEEARNRRALYELREQPEYQLAFTEPSPLVSICVPTCDGRTELLMERALPSALAQSYENIEVVVVGDAVGAETVQAIESLEDERVRFVNLTHRLSHPEPQVHWMTSALMPINEAHRQARGRWIADLDDDDALTPDAVETLLELAKSRRLEVAYGMLRQHDTNGETTNLGAFPPQSLEPDWREKGMAYEPWQGMASCGAIFHSGLRFFAREHVAQVLRMPGDYFRLERMVRAGVSFGMVEQAVYEYYPSTFWERPDQEDLVEGGL